MGLRRKPSYSDALRGLWVGERRRLWANTKPTFSQRLALVETDTRGALENDIFNIDATISANMGRWSEVGLLLGQRRR